MAEVAGYYFGVKAGGNAPPYTDPHDELKNQNVLIMHQTHAEVAKKYQVSEEELAKGIQDAKNLLAERRRHRPPPHKDTKIITAWQGLLIGGLAKAAQALQRPDLLEVALKNVDFVKRKLRDSEGHLLRAIYTSAEGQIEQIERPIFAFADDFTFLIDGVLELHTAAPHRVDLVEWAAQLQTELDASFWDDEKDTGYFLSRKPDGAGSGDEVFCRSIEDQDGAEPSPNSVAVSNLARLAELTGQLSYCQRARDILKGASTILGGHPFALARMLAGARRLDHAPPQIVIVGEDKLAKDFVAEVGHRYLPYKCLLHLKKSDVESWLVKGNEHLSSLLAAERTTAFVCRDFTCGLPLTDLEAFKKSLDDLAENK